MVGKLLLNSGTKFQGQFIISHMKLKNCYGAVSSYQGQKLTIVSVVCNQMVQYCIKIMQTNFAKFRLLFNLKIADISSHVQIHFFFFLRNFFVCVSLCVWPGGGSEISQNLTQSPTQTSLFCTEAENLVTILPPKKFLRQ